MTRSASEPTAILPFKTFQILIIINMLLVTETKELDRQCFHKRIKLQ